tara:strand:- start:151 stop:849 length:699 start_codon:yes stop_codon:yes gene_type:complete
MEHTKDTGEQIVLVDIDETICFYEGKRVYGTGTPSKENIDKINKLYDEGWKVVYWTARGGSDKSKRSGVNYHELTENELKSWGCKFHDLCTGATGYSPKPLYDLVVDDKAKRIEELYWEDLAPEIHRQRLVIEGTLHNPFTPEEMTRYSNEITDVLNMTAVTAPVCNYDSNYGWCAYTHWKESGMHIYGWDDRSPAFFSVDLYTCKKFKPQDAVNYTEEFFGDNLIKVVWKE